jgi:RNA polymerase sigma-70 factor (ECF subfamily)
MPDDQEADAIRRVLAGDTEAFRVLVHRYERPILCMLRAMQPNWHSAEDVAQEVFVAAYQHLGDCDAQQSRFSTWLFTIARNKCLKALKKRSPVLLPEPPPRADPQRPEDRLVEKELQEHLDRSLARLPVEQKTAFVLAEFVGLATEEIARIENVEPGTIRSRLSRAKAALRVAMRQFKGENLHDRTRSN